MGGNPLINYLVRPFDPAEDKPADMGLGGLSTEYLSTEDAPEGGFWNIPLIWWQSGKPMLVEPEQAQQFARDYERFSGRRFPRFASVSEGVNRAQNRSAMGGAEKNPLATYIGDGFKK